MTPSKKIRDRHGQTISAFPRRKPLTSGAKKKDRPPPAYPHGYFLELVVRFDWPPSFVPGEYKSNAASAAAATRTAEARKGHAGHALNLPGATKYNGPVGKM
jgi:hypothetical protein